jgi:Protein of unknown function (DUF1573)
MKYLFSIAFILLQVVCFAQNNNTGAKFKFVQETHDFGNLKEGDEATYEFAFTNSGNEPLVINNATASCGCTVPTWPRNPIMPNSKGVIFVKFDTKGKNGPFKKVVYIESNAVPQEMGKQKFELNIIGSVNPAIVPAVKH